MLKLLDVNGHDKLRHQGDNPAVVVDPWHDQLFDDAVAAIALNQYVEIFIIDLRRASQNST